MTLVDQLSDTTYRKQAVEQLDQLVGDNEPFPVQRSQIYGLRQIARQQPGKVTDFACHQRERARHKHGKAPEIAFWDRVLISVQGVTDWSVHREGEKHLPAELRNIPEKQEVTTTEARSRRKQLRKQKKKWLEKWDHEHIPAFFERFCTHALYRQGMAESASKE